MLRPGDRHAVQARVRRLNEMGFSVDEIELEPGAPDGRVRLRLAVTTRRFHARELERLTGITALENQARLLMNDLRQYGAWLEWAERRPLEPGEAAQRWLTAVFRPALDRIRESVSPGRDFVQAYCDLLEHKWLLSEPLGRDIGLERAISSYLAAGAPGGR